MKVAKRRLFLHVQLHPKTVTKFEKTCDQFGTTPYKLASRLMHWFADQEPQIRQSILSARSREEMQAAAIAVLERIATESKMPNVHEQKLIR